MSSYATPTDLTTYGTTVNAVSQFTTQQQQAALDTAATLLDGYLGARFVLPLKTFGSDIKRFCAVVAAFDLLTGRGLDPDAGITQILQQRYDSVLNWAKMIARGEVVPVVQDSSALAAQDPGGGGAFVSQASVDYSVQPTPQQTLGGAPPTTTQTPDGGQLVVGSPRLRGW